MTGGTGAGGLWSPRASLGEDRDADWTRVRVVVAGLGVSGFACADALAERGADVLVLDDADSDAHRERATLLDVLGAEVRLGPGATATLPEGTDLVLTSPGWAPSTPLLAEAAQRDIAIWGEPELAWRLSDPARGTQWLGITGTNGKTTTTQMLEAMLLADGRRAAAVGNIGRPVIETVLDPQPHDTLAIELSSFQLHWSPSLRLHSAAVLNLEPDHLEWYSAERQLATSQPGFEPMAAYRADKARIYHGVSAACVYNVADPATERMVEEADVVEGARAIGVTLGMPGPSMLGVVDDLLVDRAFLAQRRDSALELASVSDVSPQAPHNVQNALAAAALARSAGVDVRSVRAGLRAVELGGHRIAEVLEREGVRWIDDSKATNPHAAEASLLAFDPVVWIAGGQAKGTSFDDLVQRCAGRLRGVVLLGVDAPVLAAALARHAPDVPTITVPRTDTGAMAEAVDHAAELARPGDAVLLAPGCASLDMWPGYAARGDDFAAAVRALGQR